MPGFSVETQALLDEAQLWETKSLVMDDISTKADALRFGDPGIFGAFVPQYHAVVDLVVARCAEGRDRMVEIRDRLSEIASLYERSEERNSSRLRSSGELPK